MKEKEKVEGEEFSPSRPFRVMFFDYDHKQGERVSKLAAFWAAKKLSPTPEWSMIFSLPKLFGRISQAITEAEDWDILSVGAATGSDVFNVVCMMQMIGVNPFKHIVWHTGLYQRDEEVLKAFNVDYSTISLSSGGWLEKISSHIEAHYAGK